MKYTLFFAFLLTSCASVDVKSDDIGKIAEQNVQLLRELKQTQEQLIIIAEQNKLLAEQNMFLKGILSGKSDSSLKDEKLESH